MNLKMLVFSNALYSGESIKNVHTVPLIAVRILAGLTTPAHLEQIPFWEILWLPWMFRTAALQSPENAQEFSPQGARLRHCENEPDGRAESHDRRTGNVATAMDRIHLKRRLPERTHRTNDRVSV